MGGGGGGGTHPGFGYPFVAILTLGAVAVMSRLEKGAEPSTLRGGAIRVFSVGAVVFGLSSLRKAP